MLKTRLSEALKKSPYWTAKTKESSNTIQGLICPICGDKNAWAYKDEPMAINCNRLSQCGARTRTTELFPEIRENIESDYPATKTDPHRPAREYLLSRGISEDTLNGLNYRYLKNARNTGIGAVMFLIGKDSKGNNVLNGRLFKQPVAPGKTHNIGSTSGLFWKHPNYTYNPDQNTWITEGILDALSLLQLGEQAIAVLSAGQDPSKIDLSEFKKLILSFDNDEAGHRATKNWLRAYETAEILLCDPGQDWNDFLISGDPEQVKSSFRACIPRFSFNGKLAISESAQQYADTWHDYFHKAPGLFHFGSATFYSEKKVPRGGKDDEAFIAVSRAFKGVITVDSFIVDRSNPAKPEYLYNLKISPGQGRNITGIATGSDLASHRRLKEWFLTYAKINFEGDAKACTALASRIAEDKKAPEVKQLTVSGYQPETGDYVFFKWAVDATGKALHPDKQGNFKIGFNQHVRPPSHAEEKAILPTAITKENVKDIYWTLYTAWGMNGIAALSWMIAGWFVNQIKVAVDFFPFLSLFGDPASGKSALVTILNAIQGRDIEGLPITQLNTRKGLTRTIGQHSGLFTALLEDSERNEKGFDYSILLTAFNRGPLQVQAAFSSDLQTKEAPFLGCLLFCQNVEPFAKKQEKQRVISLKFTSDQLTDESRQAYEKIISLPKSNLAGILQQVLLNRDHFSSWQKEYQQSINDLSPMDERRILQNHALILAFHRLFCSCFDIDHNQDATLFFSDTGKEKCKSSAIRQTTLADHFFELLDTIDDSKHLNVFHFDDQKNKIYVNLPGAVDHLRSSNIQINETFNTALQKHPAFIRNGLKYRFPNDPEKDDKGRIKQRRVWVFDLQWFLKTAAEES